MVSLSLLQKCRLPLFTVRITWLSKLEEERTTWEFTELMETQHEAFTPGNVWSTPVCLPGGAELGRGVGCVWGWGGVGGWVGGGTGHLSREVALQTDEFDLETQHAQAMLSESFSKHCLNTGMGCGRQKAEMAPKIPLVFVYVLRLFNPSLF